ncbi:hypothetical protein AAY473_013308 [Plecturocebus cupreus]
MPLTLSNEKQMMNQLSPAMGRATDRGEPWNSSHWCPERESEAADPEGKGEPAVQLQVWGQQEPQSQSEQPGQRWTSIQVDFTEMPQIGRLNYLLVMVNHLSSWVEAFPFQLPPLGMWLECSGAISAHYNLCLPDSNDSPASAS